MYTNVSGGERINLIISRSYKIVESYVNAYITKLAAYVHRLLITSHVSQVTAAQ